MKKYIKPTHTEMSITGSAFLMVSDTFDATKETQTILPTTDIYDGVFNTRQGLWGSTDYEE